RGSLSALISRSAVTSAAQQGAAVASTVVASAAARMAPPGVVLDPFEVAGMLITKKHAMCGPPIASSPAAPAWIMIEGADRAYPRTSIKQSCRPGQCRSLEADCVEQALQTTYSTDFQILRRQCERLGAKFPGPCSATVLFWYFSTVAIGSYQDNN